jgi:hypothetical protein
MTSDALSVAEPLEVVPAEVRPEQAAAPVKVWSWPVRFAFRYCFAFFVLNILPFPFSYIPYVSVVAKPWNDFWGAVVPAASEAVFRVSAHVRPNGSGDTTWNWVQIFLIAVLSLVIAAAWSILDRQRLAYPRLHEALRVVVRFFVAVSMIGYGIIKVIQSQFLPPTLEKLIQPAGDMSPMGLLWFFMGYSQGYNVFTGMAELVGGLLLTTRRTTLLGALVSIGVMANIVALNFFYDVPVKLYSSLLLLMVCFLAAPDLKRMMCFFVLNRSTPPDAAEPLIRKPWMQTALVVVRTLIVGWFVWTTVAETRTFTKDLLADRSPLRGIWTIETLTVDGQDRPAVITDAKRWRRVATEHAGPYFFSFSFYTMDGLRDRFVGKIDQKKKLLALEAYRNPRRTGALTYDRKDEHTMILTGTLEGHAIRAVCRREPEKQFFLMARGFHWIQEYPLNR